MPTLPPATKWSLNKCWALDGSPSQQYLHFLFISNWQMKGFVLLLKESQAFAQSGGRRLCWAEGGRAKTLELLPWLIVPEEWTVGERAEGSLRWFPRRGLFVCLSFLAGKKRPGQLYLKHNNNDFLEPLAHSYKRPSQILAVLAPFIHFFIHQRLIERLCALKTEGRKTSSDCRLTPGWARGGPPASQAS